MTLENHIEHGDKGFVLTQIEWGEIRKLCTGGQLILKPSSFGYHRRLLTITNDNTLSWQTKSISLCSIRRLTIGNPPKKIFRKSMTSSRTYLWITIASTDRSVSLLYPDISSRNFWIKAITIYMSHLPQPLHIKSMDELQFALELHQQSSKCTHIHYGYDGAVKPVFKSLETQTNINTPTIQHDVTEKIDPDQTPNAEEASILPTNTKTNIQIAEDASINQEIKENNCDSAKHKETLDSTVSINIDYASILQQPEDNAFQNSASSSSTQPIFDAVSVDTLSKSPSIDNTVCSVNTQRSLESMKTKPTSIVIPQNNNEAAKPLPTMNPKPKRRKSSRSLSISSCGDVPHAPIPKKLLQSLGVDTLSKLTITMMRNGEQFKIHFDSDSSIIAAVHLNSVHNGLIMDDCVILFSNIVGLYAGKHEQYPNANPCASFMIEYTTNDTSKCILLEIVHKEKYLARRNWWINSIISCVAHYIPYRVPPSISSVSKILSAVTDDTGLFKLVFVNINEIEETFSMSISVDTDHNDVSIDAENARKRALERVRRYKQLQKDIQNMSIKSRDKVQHKVEEISTTISIESIPYYEETLELLTLKSNQNDDKESKIFDVTIDSLDQEEQKAISMDVVKHDEKTERQIEAKKEGINRIEFASKEDAAKMRSTILNLTKKLKFMENLQNTQATKMQQFMQKEAKTIKRYQSEMKKLKKELRLAEHKSKDFELKSEDAEDQRKDLEKELALQKWEKSKTNQNKFMKIKSSISKMNKDMEHLYGKLEKAENGYNAINKNYIREQKQKERLQKKYENLEQRYICASQQFKDDFLEVTQKYNESKREIKRLSHSLSHSEQNESKLQELLRNEIERSDGFQRQISNLYKH